MPNSNSVNPVLSISARWAEYSKQLAEQEIAKLDRELDIIDAARNEYGSDDVEIDDGAQISASPGESGCFVQAWVWVSYEEAGI